MKKVLLVLSVSMIFLSCKKEEVQQNESNSCNIEQLNIGSWDMDDKQGLEINLSNSQNISFIDVSIVSDENGKTSLLTDGTYIIENNSLFLIRKENGYFDQEAFNDNTINRGVITIHYSE